MIVYPVTLFETKAREMNIFAERYHLGLDDGEDEVGNIIAKIACEASKRAIEETFAAGRPVTTVKYGWIVKQYADGRTEFISKLK